MKFAEVSKQYGAVTALDKITLELEEGKITALLGESGAGKSTLLNAAAGLIPFAGTIEGVGKVSYLFQSAKLLPNLTLIQNLRFVLPAKSEANAEEMLARVGLSGREKSYPHELSGGERQRVAIARAFLFPHDTLLMDEPFSSLDLALKKTLVGLVYELWLEKKSTVVFVTHDVREAELLSHRGIVLKKGRVVYDAPIEEPFPRDFFRPQPVESAFVKALTGETEC